jgi:uncharacterized protein YcgL (UPF0745 family)
VMEAASKFLCAIYNQLKRDGKYSYGDGSCV